MKRVLILLAAFLVAALCTGGKRFIPWTTAAGGPTPTLKASTSAALGISGGTTSAIDTTGANLLIIAVGWYQTTPVTPTDSKGNTWTKLTTSTASNDSKVSLWYCQGGTVGSGHTFTYSQISSYSSIAVLAFDNISASPFDQENTNAVASSTTLQTGSITPSQANTLAITAASLSVAGTITINDSFQSPPTQVVEGSSGSYVGVAATYKVLSSSSAVNPTFTSSTSQTWSAAIANFKY